MLKNLFAFLLLATSVIYFSACTDTATNPVNSPKTATIKLISTPAGAKIYVNGIQAMRGTTAMVTPDSVTVDSTIVNASVATIKLSLTGYKDTTFSIGVIQSTTTTKTVVLTQATQVNLSTYTNVTIYESVDPSSTHPSGIALKTGEALSISTAANASKVDLYYLTSGDLVASANDFPPMTRTTYFQIGSGTVLTDGVASAVKDGTWLLKIPTSTTQYFFMMDSDGYYSKGIITGRGGSGNARWLTVSWLYNRDKTTQF